MNERELVELLGLEPHPEGGFFAETYRAPASLGVDGGGSTHRAASSAIYFLLPADAFSAFHAIVGADEIWHHYLGGTVEIHTLGAEGRHRVSLLGSDLGAGERPHVVVPAGTVQAAVVRGDRFALCGCTVAPAFQFEDFTMPARAELLARFPEHAAIIRRLTRS